MSEPQAPSTVEVRADRPLLIVDVDEVLGLFMHGFGRFVAERGYELRLERFALFQNLYQAGASEPLDLATGRVLFDDFFRFGAEDMDPAPHAVESLTRLSRNAHIVVLTNAPGHAREPRGRWLARHGIDFPLVINEGPKGAAVATLAARTLGPAAFVDDLLPNLDSAALAAPAVHRFQLVADERLRLLAPAAPERHRRIDHWP
ncbi:MAG: hypothetical protein P4M09_29130, partial [Devosia sp.]|nr:hypothetical protein [Devosia sp.]